MMTRRKPRSLPLQGAHGPTASDHGHGWFVIGRTNAPRVPHASSAAPTDTTIRERSCHWFVPRKST
jgi:hypothetical protein